jgi:hypothetical protein
MLQEIRAKLAAGALDETDGHPTGIGLRVPTVEPTLRRLPRDPHTARPTDRAALNRIPEPLEEMLASDGGNLALGRESEGSWTAENSNVPKQPTVRRAVRWNSAISRRADNRRNWLLSWY